MTISERRFALRKHTQTAHERLDAAVGGFGTMEEYRRYLMGLGMFRASMEETLRGVAWPADWAWRPTVIAASLARDAIDLGLPTIQHIPSDMDLSDRSVLLGALYVLEGSTLGARILRQRAAKIGLEDNFGARHLAAMSNDIARWHSFLVVLDQPADFDVQRAAASANAVFALAIQCFESELLLVH